MKTKIIAALAIFIVFPIVANAAEETPVTDENFLKSFSQLSLRELELGKLAAKRANRADVRDFGKSIASDHKELQEEIQLLANNQGILVAMERATGEHSAAWDTISKLGANDFDNSYLDQVAKDHQLAIQLLQQERKSGQNSKIRDFAGNALATERLHLERAESVQAGPPLPTPSKKTEYEKKPAGFDPGQINAR